MQVIQSIQLPTVNRGVKTFLVSQDKKGFYAHEVGEPTQWAQVFNTEDKKAHRLNPTRIFANQYTRYWTPKPFKYINQAWQAITEQANTNVQYF